MNVLGMISGTSFDGIDVACAAFEQHGDELVLTPLGSESVPYPDPLRAQIAAALPPAATTLAAVCRLDTQIGQAFAAAARQALDAFGAEVDLIVSHGQTVFHWIDLDGRARGTLQLGQPAWIAEETGVPVLSDIRSRDLAAGGHGAPLVSVFDVLALQGPDHVTAALNLGGISNLTVLIPGRDPIAYDVGPANALLDAAVRALTGGREEFDAGGAGAARGRLDESLLERLLDEPYYSAPPPKSTGKELFHLGYLVDRIGPVERWAADDTLATLAALTARTVAAELSRWNVREVLASGGGTSNVTVMRMLREAVPGVRLAMIDELGVPAHAKEAYAFALIGYLTAHGLPGTVPSCTGASGARLLGTLTPGRGPLRLPEPYSTAPARLVIGARDASGRR
jgi:anhydro-N-acetylmuramic acid kinase